MTALRVDLTDYLPEIVACLPVDVTGDDGQTCDAIQSGCMFATALTAQCDPWGSLANCPGSRYRPAVAGYRIATGGTYALENIREKSTFGYNPMISEESLAQGLSYAVAAARIVASGGGPFNSDISFAQDLPVTPVVRSSSEDFERIQDVFHPAITDLALALEVTRQTIYNWKDGGAIASANACRLAEFARMADAFAAEGLAAPGAFFRRPIAGGKNIFEIFRSGVDTTAAVRALAGISHREARQRETIRKRLAGRPRPEREDFVDAGIPMLGEDD
jgi:hypothetical protein